jgi:hypothetical protein
MLKYLFLEDVAFLLMGLCKREQKHQTLQQQNASRHKEHSPTGKFLHYCYIIMHKMAMQYQLWSFVRYSPLFFVT